MSQFGPQRGQVDPRQQMADWINNAPPADLAAELMGAFGVPGWGTGDNNVMGYDELKNWLFRGHPDPKPKMFGFSRTPSLTGPIREALQLLQNSELVVMWCGGSSSSGPIMCYQATRLGMATLATGNAAVRQRINDRTGL
jgi:hypothetical protein